MAFPAPPRVPREYGAWVMLILPVALGLAAAGPRTLAPMLVVPATVFLFLGRFAAIAGGTRVTRLDSSRIVWTLVYFAMSAACLLAAIAWAPAPLRRDALLLAFVTGLLGVVNAGLVLAGRGRHLVTESLAMAAIAAAAPLVIVLAGEPLGGPAIAVGGLCLAYFLSTLLFVRAHRALRDAPTRVRALAFCVGGHLVLGAALVGMARAGWLPFAALLSFGPPLVRTATGLTRPARNLRVLGWREVAVASAFLALAGFTL